jgi:hypothetical protein
MPRQPEGRLVKRIKAYIREKGGRVFNIHGGDNPYQEVGIPDLLICYRGQFVGLEVKQPGEQPSAIQKQILREIEAAGGYALAVSTLEEVVDLLAEIDQRSS